MKNLKMLSVLGMVCLPLASFAQYGVPVPFDNLQIAAKQKLYIHYQLPGKDSTLICTESSGDLGTIQWSYKGVKFTGQLPITLSDNMNLQTQRIDLTGQVTISNPYSDAQQLVVSCKYGSPS